VNVGKVTTICLKIYKQDKIISCASPKHLHTSYIRLKGSYFGYFVTLERDWMLMVDVI